MSVPSCKSLHASCKRAACLVSVWNLYHALAPVCTLCADACACCARVAPLPEQLHIMVWTILPNTSSNASPQCALTTFMQPKTNSGARAHVPPCASHPVAMADLDNASGAQRNTHLAGRGQQAVTTPPVVVRKAITQGCVGKFRSHGCRFGAW